MQGTGVASAPLTFGLAYLDRQAAFCNLIPGRRPGALREPDQHAQAEPVDLSVLDLRYPTWLTPSCSAASVCVNPDLFGQFLMPESDLARISALRLFLGEEVVEY